MGEWPCSNAFPSQKICHQETNLDQSSSALGDKNKDSGKGNVVVVNMCWLDWILLGKVTIDELVNLEPLTKDCLKGDVYQSEGVTILQELTMSTPG